VLYAELTACDNYHFSHIAEYEARIMAKQNRAFARRHFR